MFTDHDFDLVFAGDAAPMRLLASTLLMENVASGRVLEGRADGDVVAVQDELGRPILLSLATDRHLYAVVSAARDGDERVELDLTAGFGDARVLAFGAGQSNRGDIHLAIALVRGGDVELHVTRPLSHAVGATPWHDFHGQWLARGAHAGDVAVTRVLVGNEPVAPGHAPLIVLATQEGREGRYYQGDSDLAAPPAAWRHYRLPENAGKVLDLAVGRTRRGGDGVYALFEQAGARRLFFVPHDPQAQQPELPLPPGLATSGALGVLTAGARGETDLYLVGDGVYLLPAGAQRTGATLDDVTTLAAPELARGLRNVLVCDDDQSISVWAIDGAGELLYLQGTRTGPRLAALDEDPEVEEAAAVEWSNPVPRFRTDVQLIAPLRNRLQRANSLITVGKGRGLEQLRQTPGDGTWRGQSVAVRDDAHSESFHCYATNLSLVDGDGQPPAEPPTLRVTASERLEAVINGVVHDLGPTRAVEVRPDERGHVTIVNRVRTLASPLFYVEGAGEQRLVVDPAKKVRAAMSELDTAEKLAAATLPDGTPALSGLSDHELKHAADILGKLRDVAGKLPTDGSAGGAAMAAQAPLTGEHGVWFSFGSDGAELHHCDHTAPLAGAEAGADLSWLAGAVQSAAGAVLQAMGNLANRAWNAAVVWAGQAWDFAVKLGERVYRFAIDCLARADQLVAWLVEHVIKVPFEKAVKWLGHVFGWDDIVVTHDVMVNVAEQVLRRAEESAGELAAHVDGFFGRIIGELERMPAFTDPRIGQSLAAQTQAGQRELAGDGRSKLEPAADFQRSPAGQYASDHLRYNLRGGPTGERDGLMGELGGVMRDLWGQIGPTVLGLATDLGAMVRGGTLSISELLTRLAGKAAIGMLQSIRIAAVGAARLAGQLVAKIRELLLAPLPIPVLGALYQRYVGKPMSLLGGVILLLSVPATTLHKVLTGEAPFPPKQDDDGLAATKKPPETYGLDVLYGAAFWAALAVPSGIAGVAVGAPLFALYRCNNVFQIFADKAVKDLQSITEFPIVKLAIAAFKVVKVVGLGMWTGLSAILWPDTAGGLIRAGRWTVSVFAVAGELISMGDPSDFLGGMLRLVAAVLDWMLAVVWWGIRMVRHGLGDNRWLWLVDVGELVTVSLGHLSTLCSVASLLGEPASRTALKAAGWVASGLMVPAWLTVNVMAPYIPRSHFAYPIV